MSERSILVVDDEVPIAEAVRARLASEGYHVRVAHDGPEALRASAEERPDLVVLDLMLPGMDGLEVCREMQTRRLDPRADAHGPRGRGRHRRRASPSARTTT